jgi:formylglycine-generating enzyme required for sulfatase activity
MLQRWFPRGISLALLIGLLVLGNEAAFAENRQALLIANGSYANFSSLATPVSEAQELAAALKGLGFQVTLLKNASREQMLDALDAFGNSFKGKGGTAFFHYGGHGVQVAGKNYLIPVDADIPDERKASTRAVDVDEIMTTLDASGADTSIVCLDACRNNPLPAGAARSASRGLSVVGIKPKNSVIVYAAEAGTTAQDGLFTPALTRALARPGLSLSEVFTEVRRQVYEQSSGAQTPGEYNQLFSQVYLAGAPGTAAVSTAELTPKVGTITVTPGSLRVSVVSAGTLQVAGQQLAVPAGASVPLDNLAPGEYPLSMTYADGTSESRAVRVGPGQAAVAAFTYEPPAAAAAPQQSARVPMAPGSSGLVFVAVQGGIFRMGGPGGVPPHEVTLSAFTAATTEVTQELYQKVMGRNPSSAKGGQLPVENVSWYEAVEFCNKLSEIDGLKPAYSIRDTSVRLNAKAAGYRLPTSAEWEYAARGGTRASSLDGPYAGSVRADDVAWDSGNSGSQTQPVAQKKPNSLGLFDMEGNVSEWCGDWNAVSNPGASQVDPPGPASGTERKYRGGNASQKAQVSTKDSWADPGSKSAFLGFRVVRTVAAGTGAAGSGDPSLSRLNSAGMTMIRVGGGTFRMGLTQLEAMELMPEWKNFGWMQSSGKNMQPHDVWVSSFRISSTAVTQAQFQKVMKSNPSHIKGDTLPVETVSWFDAVKFCNALSKAEGLDQAYSIKGTTVSCNFTARGYRLPTEAEWEYAARGGAAGSGPEGRSPDVAYAGSANPDEVAWTKAISLGTTHPVGQLDPNGYGLYDMAGNVWQWCWDWYGPYGAASATDPTGPAKGEQRVMRGGAYNVDAPFSRSAVRWSSEPDPAKIYSIGFRIAAADR